MSDADSRQLRHLLAAVACGAVVIGAASSRPDLDLFAWSAGTPRAEVEQQLRAAGYRPIARGRDGLLLVTPVFDALFAQQRTLADFDSGGRLTAMSVHLVPERDDEGEALLHLYEEARRLVVGRLGPPGWAREEGRAAPGNALADLAGGHIVRCLQWEGEWTVRLGIPRAASGRTRVELLLAPGELPAAEGFWGREF